MDAELIQSLARLSPTNDDLSSPLGSSIAKTQVGDLLVLTGDGEVVVTSLRQGKTNVQTLPIDKNLANMMKNFRHINANKDGSRLLLWSTHYVAVLEIPLSWLQQGNITIPPSETSSSGSKSSNYPTLTFKLLCEVSSGGNKVVKTIFHPWCDHSVVVLREKEVLSLYDMRFDSFNKQDIKLPPNLTFVSFTFGPSIEWLRYTIFLVTTRNEIYFLCPILPAGTTVPSNTVKELWSWYDVQKSRILKSSKRKVKMDNYDGNSDSNTYLDITRQYLEETIGLRPSSHSDVSDESLAVLAGELSKLSVVQIESSKGFEFVSLGHVLLQGPLPLHKGQPRGIGGNISFDAVSDISTPHLHSSSLSPPVITLAYKSGQVDLLLLDPQDDTMFFVHPGWGKVNQDLTIGKPPCCLVADSFLVDNSSSGAAVWTLIPDPGFPHQMFCLDINSSNSYILSSAWLERALRMVDQALEGHANDEIDNINSLQSLCLPLRGDKAIPSRKLNGMVAIHDPFAGHISLMRLQNGEFVAINMTMHSKLCAMQFRKKDQSVASSTTDKLKGDFRNLSSNETLRWRQSQKLIEKIAKGLNNPPELEVTIDPKTNKMESHGEAYKNKVLTEAANRLEQNVLLPMRELHEATSVHMKLVEEMYRVQREIIEGSDEKSSGTILATGLKKLIVHLMSENKQLVQRLSKLEECYNNQRELADTMLLRIYAQRNKKLTSTEKVYYQQLQDWVDKVRGMEKDISIIRKNTQTKIFFNPSDVGVSIGTFSSSNVPSGIFSPSMPPLQRSPLPSTPGTAILSLPHGTSTPGPDANATNMSISSMYNSRFQQTPTKLGLSSPYAHFTPKTIVNKSISTTRDQPTVQLSEEELKTCSQLLDKQSAEIEECKTKVEELQRKVDIAKKLAKLDTILEKN